MPYYTGIVTSAADLITAVENAATAEGWSVSSHVVSKGDIYATLSEGDLGESAQGVYVQASSGSASGNLCGNAVGMTTDLSNVLYGSPLTYPATYHIFINTLPDDIIVMVNYSGTYWQQLAFGQASVIGVAGSGVYCWGTVRKGHSLTYLGFNYNQSTGEIGWCFYPINTGSSVYANSFIYLNSQSYGWWGNKISPDGGDGAGKVGTYISAYPVINYQPNTWNNESILIRVQLMAYRPSSYYSYAAELPHIRYINNKWIDDEEVLSLGGDDWFVASAFKKNVGSFTTGTSAEFAFAVRKTA